MTDLAHYGPWAVIAGGSEGVGAEFALQLAQAGVNLVLIARKPGPLEETAQAGAGKGCRGTHARSRSDFGAIDQCDHRSHE
ncbi:MAG: SDR family NAD(P)-dependent oxidoreductase [Marmoricola sp.]